MKTLLHPIPLRYGNWPMNVNVINKNQMCSQRCQVFFFFNHTFTVVTRSCYSLLAPKASCLHHSDFITASKHFWSRAGPRECLVTLSLITTIVSHNFTTQTFQSCDVRFLMIVMIAPSLCACQCLSDSLCFGDGLDVAEWGRKPVVAAVMIWSMGTNKSQRLKCHVYCWKFVAQKLKSVCKAFGGVGGVLVRSSVPLSNRSNDVTMATVMSRLSSPTVRNLFFFFFLHISGHILFRSCS